MSPILLLAISVRRCVLTRKLANCLMGGESISVMNFETLTSEKNWRFP